MGYFVGSKKLRMKHLNETICYFKNSWTVSKKFRGTVEILIGSFRRSFGTNAQSKFRKENSKLLKLNIQWKNFTATRSKWQSCISLIGRIKGFGWSSRAIRQFLVGYIFTVPLSGTPWKNKSISGTSNFMLNPGSRSTFWTNILKALFHCDLRFRSCCSARAPSQFPWRA